MPLAQKDVLEGLLRLSLYIDVATHIPIKIHIGTAMTAAMAFIKCAAIKAATMPATIFINVSLFVLKLSIV